jgi:hypothetical protein
VELPRSLTSHEKELLREALAPGAAASGKRDSFFRRRT